MEMYIRFIQLFFIMVAIGSGLWFFRAVWMDAAKSPYSGILLLAALVVVIGVYISASVFPESGITGWDEARNALRALFIARDIKEANLAKLWQDTNAQTIWGPGYAWLLASVYIMTGESLSSAIILSLTLFLASAFLLYRIGLRLDPEKGWLVGLVSASLTLSAPQAIHLSVAPMIEHMVVFFLLLTVLAGIDARTPFRMAVFSLLMALMFLTKYNYAILLLISKASADILEIILDYREKKKIGEKVKRILFYSYGPFLLIAATWFSIDSINKTGEFFSFVINIPRVESSPMSSDSLLFYPRLFLSAYSVFPWLSILLFPFLITGLWLSIGGAARRISILFLVSFLGITAHPYKAARFLVPILPFFWLFAALGLVGSLRWITQRMNKFASKAVEAVIVLFFLVIIPFKVCSAVKPQAPYYYSGAVSGNPAVTESVKAALRLVESEVSGGRGLAVWGTFAEMSPALIAWHLETTVGKEGKRYDLFLEPSRKDAGGIEERISWLSKQSKFSIITFHVDRISPFYNDDYRIANAWKLDLVNFLSLYHENYGLKLQREEEFPDVGLTVRVYRSGET